MHILNLSLASTARAQQQTFYSSFLERMPCIATEHELCYQVGQTLLCFVKSEDTLPGRYHIAFNIPENQFDEAKSWLAQYTSLLKETGGQDTFYSEHWDADMLYFNDADGNILELIARHSLANTSSSAFSAASLLNISEIGIACDDFAALAAELNQRIDAQPYHWEGSDSFMPIGDEHGLFIVVKPGRIWFPDTGVPAWHLSLIHI